MNGLRTWLIRVFRRGKGLPRGPDPNAAHQFFSLGFQYYVAARGAAMAQLMPVSGNLYHHAIEMLLKGQLSKSMPLEELRKKYGHGLKRAWKSFKNLYPTVDLSPCDSLVAALDRFERLRYPDNALKEGMSCLLAWDPPSRTAQSHGLAKQVPHYEFAVTDLDRFIAELVRRCSINPRAYFEFYNHSDFTRKILEDNNPAWTSWFPVKEVNSV